jgi:Ca-activated chloride channel family protein
MAQKFSPQVAILLSLSVAGCAGVPLSAMPAGSESKSLAPGTASDLMSPSGGSAARPATAPTTAPASSGANGSGTTTGGAAAPSNPVSGIGLSSFFDTYNFNFPVPAGQSLGTVANSSHKLVAPEGGKVYLQIGLQTTDKAPTNRQPLNISFVFDKSGSMYGEKIQYSKIAAKEMIDQLGAQDTFSLVTFDTDVSTLITPAFAVRKDEWKPAVDSIEPGSSTNIDGGLERGYVEVQKNYKPESINRVILMSDGEANVGITDAPTLGKRATAFAGEGISLTTIGVGTGFNEGFMTQLATAGKGTFYFANSAEAAKQAFAGEVTSLQRTVARNVKLAVNVADGVKVLNVYGHSSKTEGQSLNVDSNDLILSQSKVILLELQVPAGAEGVEKAIANVKVDFDDVVNGGHKQAIAEAKVAYTADAAKRDAGMDSKIASSVIILQTASVLIRAAELLDGGQKAQAKAELLQQFEIVNAKAAELKDKDLQDEATNLKQYLDRVDGTDVEVLKKELQFDAFQKQQGKKKVIQPAA